MIGENGTPVTPDWTPIARDAMDFTRAEVKPACQLCKQQPDGRGDE